MRILHVIRTLNPAWGGPVEVIRQLVNASALRNVCNEIVCVDNPSAGWLQSWTVPIAAVGEGFSSFGYSRALDQWLDASVSRFDAIIVHSIWMYFSLSARRAALRGGVPYYLYIHGALDPWFKERYPLKHIKKVLYWRLFEHKVVRDAAAVLFTTEEEKHLAQDSFMPYLCSPAVVGCGTEVPDEALEAADQSVLRGELSTMFPELKQRRYFLYLGRIHEKKGVDLVLQGFAQAKNLYPDMALVIAGPGDKSLVESLQTLAVRESVHDQTVWTGPLYGTTKWKALKAADAFVLASHQENFGISIAEALSCGSPVLISNKINIWPEIQAEGAGIVDSDDVEGAARLFRRWAAFTEHERDAMRSRARHCFKTHFDVARSCDRLLTLISAQNAEISRATALAS
jgi:glycosyltransferase involved in cell wall biosynthesis